ncbi:MAG: right-handed parallel beta-helix repeat-containing protein [Ardenticatenaceae bacterium]|nr:right-handed parallel beta-helix repeat-containing protein [Anaerolineales bacterium]MCB8940289.1 right-handed parallel beta-helix repeat-containing protein [Ardenticatenaceae bacterium]MCB8973304.1 right-handed parallel beta-helix repeat-containing protein [Ardenticatenaceae bacterium]
MLSNKNDGWWRYGRIFLALLFGLWAITVTFNAFAWGYLPESSLGGVNVRYVSPSGQDLANSCTNLANPCATLQRAVDVALAGDEIRLAEGTYGDVSTFNGLDQIAYIDTSLTIRGGYTATDFDHSHPQTQTTILDAQTLGRGLVITGSVTAVIENLTIQNGDAAGQGGAIDTFGCNDAGGGIFAQNAQISLINNVVRDNIACDGGGIYIVNSPKAILHGNHISANQAYDYGGGFGLIGSNSAAVVENQIFQNLADEIGAGTGQKHCGGGQINNSTDVQVEGNTIYENVAANSGGGLCLSFAHSARVQNNLVYNNFRKGGFEGNGAGISIYASNSVLVVANMIYGNGSQLVTDMGTLRGGGIYAEASNNLLFAQNQIYDNLATLGGGFYLDSCQMAEFQANIIRNNFAKDMPDRDEGFGGGIFATGTDFVATNSVIIDNVADIASSGSGVHLQSSEGMFWHPTIARNNSITGTAVFLSDTLSTVTITNAIVVSHSVGIDASTGGTATVSHVLWYANNQNTVGTESVTEAITADPQFAADGFHLTLNSPALNQATISNVLTDIDGELRPAYPFLPDLGADERHYFVYFPFIAKP